MVESMQQSSTTPSLHLVFWGLRKIVACSQPYLAMASTVFGTVSSLHLITSVKIKDVGMTPCQKLLKQEGTARRIESMQQSSATPKNQRCREGVAEDCCMLSILLAVPSCFNSFWHGVIPTSYFIFNDFYTCSTHFFSHKYGKYTLGSLAIVHECRS